MRAAPGWAKAVVYTVGHSTRPLSELVAMLQSAGVVTLADVRTVPRSRSNPQFNAERLSKDLPSRGIDYVHLKELGGLRRPNKESTENVGWRNLAFRGYADYMQTDQFRDGLESLKRLAKKGPVAAMCAEGNPWRCHRNLLGDALFVRGAQVSELAGIGKWKEHRLTPFAHVDGRKVTYPAEE
jgi:uncharacterized protein (DUF488 family)